MSEARGTPMLRPCCPKEPEPGIAGRCKFRAEHGLCASAQGAAACKVACGHCQLCANHPNLRFYNNFYECSTRAFHTGILKEVCARIAETARSQDRCGATESRCAFRSECTVSGSNASYCFRGIEPDGKAKGKKAAKQPPWRHALIVSTAARYPLAAAEAQSAGFLPRRIPAIYRNYSRCIPNPDYSSSQGAKLILRIKNDNLLEAWGNAVRHIAETGIAHLVLEDDAVLATSRREVQSYLDGYSPRNSRQSVGVRRRVDGTIETELRQFARSEFDLVPLGTCGNRDRFACGHALWITPAGARSLLLANDACSLPASVGLSHGAGLRVPAFDRTFYVAAGSKGVGRYCTTQCAPNRSTFGGMPSCLDGEATEAVANRKCDDGTPFCGRANTEILRCAHWEDLKSYAKSYNASGKWNRANVMRQSGENFHPGRYMGYGHFLMDPLRHGSKVVGENGEVIAAPTFVPVPGSEDRWMLNSDARSYGVRRGHAL